MPETPLNHRSRPATTGHGPYPALILMHGLGSNEDDMMSLAPHVDDRMYVFSLRAPLPSRWGGYSWFDYEVEGPWVGGRSIGRSLTAVSQFLNAVVEDYPIDPTRIYLGGFSMGAAMTGALVLLEPERVAGGLMISGFLPPDGSPPRYRGSDAAGHPIFQAHGTRDHIVSIAFARQTRDFLQRTPVDLTYREYPIGHEVSAPELSDVAEWLTSVLDGYDAAVQR
ncbi:MAG: alpha/beta fold hydrolase [Chloroflexota bacterium]